MQFKSRKSQAGQAVLIVLLSLSVVLIVILYILSRSITDISLSSKEEDSLRAFSAAEAGIERALVIGANIPSTGLNDATFNATVTGFAQGQPSVVFPLALKSGENAIFWFTGHNPDGTTGCPASDPCFTGRQVKFFWGDVGTTGALTPALEVTIYYRRGTEYRVARAMLDPVGGRTQNPTYAKSGSTSVNGESFEFNTTLNFANAPFSLQASDVLQYATAKILYNTAIAHKVAIDTLGTGNLPSQGTKVNSNGTFGDANRSIEVYQLHPETPPIFANVVYSGSGVTK